MLKEGSLVKFTVQPESKDAPTNPPDDTTADAALTPVTIDSHLAEKLSALENYVQELHLTELSIRAALMQAIDKGGQSGESILQISTVAIATAADETEGEASAEDWKFFTADKESKEEITWKTSDHVLLGQMIYRPSSSPLVSSDAKPGLGQKCQWYKVVSYTPSVKGEATGSEDAKQSQDPNAFEPNPVVARRMRFKAIPVAESDIDADTKMEIGDNDDLDFMVLTESQVRAVRSCGLFIACIFQVSPQYIFIRAWKLQFFTEESVLITSRRRIAVSIVLVFTCILSKIRLDRALCSLLMKGLPIMSSTA
jgi:hypothetical protein